MKCDVSMAKHKPIKYLYHLQKKHRFYKASEMLYGNCNGKCKECPCGMLAMTSENHIIEYHIPEKVLKKSGATASYTEFMLRRKNGE